MAFWPFLLMTLFGHVLVKVEREWQGTVFVGVGRFGRAKHFNFNRVTSVSEVKGPGWVLTKRHKAILIDGDHPVRFGSLLDKERCHFVLAVLQQMLGERST